MLELSGVTDRDWLDGVADHHVAPDGSGYPAGHHESNDFAALVRRADIYTAKLSPRTTRSAMAADRAGRAMFMYDPGNSMTAALVKEFGVYPPGCFVKLVSGETAVVVKRGPSVVTPLGGGTDHAQRCGPDRPAAARHQQARTRDCRRRRRRRGDGAHRAREADEAGAGLSAAAVSRV